MRAARSAWYGVVHRLCPRCRAGAIFSQHIFWIAPMNVRCPVCDLRFEREPGYFLGAMYIGYGLGLLTIAIFAAALFVLTPLRLIPSVVGGVVLFLPLAPYLTHMARVLWIYLDQAVDPDKS
jgi:uncharacterized protein (DUF983 family)